MNGDRDARSAGWNGDRAASSVGWNGDRDASSTGWNGASGALLGAGDGGLNEDDEESNRAGDGAVRNGVGGGSRCALVGGWNEEHVEFGAGGLGGGFRLEDLKGTEGVF